MKPNNEYTAPNQKFFYPWNNEMEVHESFDEKTLPSHEALPGDAAYVVTIDENGEAQFRKHSGSMGILMGSTSGETIKAVVTYETDGYDSAKNPVEYTIAEDDKLILKVNRDKTFYDSEIKNQLDKDGHLVVPGGEALPYANPADNSDKLRYEITGVITADDTLLSVPGVYGSQSNEWLIDLCVANAHSETPLEVALLANDLTGRSLRNSVSMSDNLGTYLRHYDAKFGTTYMPETEPYDRVVSISSEEERNRYYRLLDAARNKR